jgi:hypothetical protein
MLQHIVTESKRCKLIAQLQIPNSIWHTYNDKALEEVINKYSTIIKTKFHINVKEGRPKVTDCEKDVHIGFEDEKESLFLNVYRYVDCLEIKDMSKIIDFSDVK